MTTPFRLDGKNALVTGAGSGVGRAIAELFAAQGASVVVVDRDREAGRATVDAVKAASGRAELAVVDVSDEGAVLALERRLPPVDILVASAGLDHAGDLSNTTAVDLDRMYAVNVRGVFNSCRAFGPPMIARGAGSVINVASVGGVVAVRQQLAYTTTQFAVVGLTKSLALDHSHTGVRFNCICPGRVEAPLTGQMAKPEEIAAAALYLAADESAMVTGSNLMIDGGWSAGR